MRVSIRGRHYTLAFVPMANDRDNDGYCDPPNQKDKRILVRRTLIGERRLEVIIHEMLHAAYWDTDEDAIREAARDIARVLHRLGYRIPPTTN